TPFVPRRPSDQSLLAAKLFRFGCVHVFLASLDEQLVADNFSLVAHDALPIDFHVTAVAEKQQLILAVVLSLPAHEFGVAAYSSLVPRRLLGEEKRVIVRRCVVEI